MVASWSVVEVVGRVVSVRSDVLWGGRTSRDPHLPPDKGLEYRYAGDSKEQTENMIPSCKQNKQIIKPIVFIYYRICQSCLKQSCYG
jgi:hypothetical protein